MLADDPKIIPQRDYNDYAKYVNENNTVKRYGETFNFYFRNDVVN